MSSIIFCKERDRDRQDYECVERKGKGHPDTLSDSLAEHLSVQYSQYTLRRFGAILHHNFDKLGLLGGQSFVKFGEGRLTHPIRVLLNGRASSSFGGKKIPIEALLEKWAADFLRRQLPLIHPKKDLRFYHLLSTASSPGGLEESSDREAKRRYWFEPRGLQDLSERVSLRSNDTSFGCGYAPFSTLEQIILKIERTLNGEGYQRKHPWIGSDIKLAGIRVGRELSITMCIPQIATYVHSMEEYQRNLETIRVDILRMIKDKMQSGYACELFLNTRDNYRIPELYLTAIGSSIESGDEGLVGRGNRVNGLITIQRPMTMEGASGKNPVYHIGKLYNLAAFRIADAVYRTVGTYTEVSLVSQSGRQLTDPWHTIISTSALRGSTKALQTVVERELRKIPKLTEEIVSGKLQTY